MIVCACVCDQDTWVCDGIDGGGSRDHSRGGVCACGVGGVTWTMLWPSRRTWSRSRVGALPRSREEGGGTGKEERGKRKED